MNGLRGAHPFTLLAISAAAAVLAVTFSDWRAQAILILILVVLALIQGAWRVLLGAGATAVPFWLFLALIHGLIREDVATALTLGARITTVILSFALAFALVHPARLLDAALARRVPFSAAYLLVATLQAVPRLRARARAILEAQRCRGLRLRGSPWRRLTALAPLMVPMTLGALAEAEDRAMALEARGAGSGERRTPLHPPRDTIADKTMRWLLLLLVLAALTRRWVA